MKNPIKKIMRREILSDVLLVSGGSAITAGLGILLGVAASLIAGGIIAILYGVAIAVGGDAE